MDIIILRLFIQKILLQGRQNENKNSKRIIYRKLYSKL